MKTDVTIRAAGPVLSEAEITGAEVNVEAGNISVSVSVLIEAPSTTPFPGSQISAEAGTVTVTTGSETYPVNFPMSWVSGGISDWESMYNLSTGDTEKLELTKKCAYRLHQANGFETASARSSNISTMVNHTAVNPAPIIWHRLNKGVECNKPGLSTQRRSNWDYIFTDGHFEGLLIGTNGDPILQEGGNYKRWAISFGEPGLKAHIADYEVNTVLDDNGGANSLLGNGMIVHWMTDGSPEMLSDSYSERQREGNLVAIQSSTEYDIPAWPGAPTTGSPDGSGYYSLSGDYYICGWKANERDSYLGEINGYKTIGGGNARVRISSAPPDYSPVAGDRFQIHEDVGTSKSADFDNDGSADPQNPGTERRVAKLAHLQAIKDQILVVGSYESGFFANGAATDATAKDNGNGAPVPSEYTGAFDGYTFENSQNNLKFRCEDGVTWDASAYNIDKYMRAIHLAKLKLKTSGHAHRVPYPFVHLDYSSGDDSYPLSVKGASLLRFILALAMSQENVFVDFRAAGSRSESRHPGAIAEQFIDIGDPLSTRSLGTYDPNANSSKGTWTWRSPDSGSHIFWTEFARGLVVFNKNDPNTSNWTPTHHGGSAPTETFTLPSAGAGNAWYRFDVASYSNNGTTHTQSGTTLDNTASAFNRQALPDGPWVPNSMVGIGKDPTLNNGAKITAAESLGAGEGILYLRGTA